MKRILEVFPENQDTQKDKNNTWYGVSIEEMSALTMTSPLLNLDILPHLYSLSVLNF